MAPPGAPATPTQLGSSPNLVRGWGGGGWVDLKVKRDRSVGGTTLGRTGPLPQLTHQHPHTVSMKCGADRLKECITVSAGS